VPPREREVCGFFRVPREARGQVEEGGVPGSFAAPGSPPANDPPHRRWKGVVAALITAHTAVRIWRSVFSSLTKLVFVCRRGWFVMVEMLIGRGAGGRASPTHRAVAAGAKSAKHRFNTSDPHTRARSRPGRAVGESPTPLDDSAGCALPVDHPTRLSACFFLCTCRGWREAVCGLEELPVVTSVNTPFAAATSQTRLPPRAARRIGFYRWPGLRESRGR